MKLLFTLLNNEKSLILIRRWLCISVNSHKILSFSALFQDLSQDDLNGKVNLLIV